jgi:hypothetical protein
VTLIVEDGTAKADAESYVPVATFKTYATAHGLAYASYTDPQIEAALRRGTSYIDTFRNRFYGYRLKLREQALEWPRAGAQDADGIYIGPNEIPVEIIEATNLAAYREMVTPGTLEPDLKRGGAIKSVSAGDVSVEWFGNASALTIFTAIDKALARLLMPSNMYSGRAVRG